MSFPASLAKTPAAPSTAPHASRPPRNHGVGFEEDAKEILIAAGQRAAVVP
jgi:hypothetical protein